METVMLPAQLAGFNQPGVDYRQRMHQASPAWRRPYPVLVYGQTDRATQPGVASVADGTMKNEGDEKTRAELLERFQAMSRGRKIVLVVFIIWAIQAIPKWTVAIVGDGETSAAIMRIFVTPRA
ncbi:MAG: hypothetical protein H6957_11630 [Chromatiaceae bacterium]|nr:hypothetical protein [Chromatiaceae bacterium]